MSEKKLNFWDIPLAEATRDQNVIDIQKKIAENKRITSNKEIQTQLLKEFLAERKNAPKTQEMIEIFKWKREEEKNGREFNISQLTKHNVIAVSEQEIREGKSRSIANYMKIFEQQKQYSFTKEDLSEITQSMVDLVNHFVSTGNAFFSYNGIFSDPKRYKEYLQNSHLQKEVTDFVDKERTISAIDSIVDLFNALIRDYGRSDFNCKVEERREIVNKHIELVMGFLALSGDVQRYEAFKSHQNIHHGSDSKNYDTIKKISIFKGNLDDAIIASYGHNATDLNKIIHGKDSYNDNKPNPYTRPRRSDLSGEELEVLAKNVAYNEKKEKVLHEIYYIVQNINKALGEKKYKEDDFRVYDENKAKRGEEGKKLYAQSYGDIMSAKEKFEAELESLKKEKKAGLPVIISNLQNNSNNKQ